MLGLEWLANENRWIGRDVTENKVEITETKPIWFDDTLLETPLELGDNGWLTVLADLKEMPAELQRVDFYLSQMMAMDQQLRVSGQPNWHPSCARSTPQRNRDYMC